MRKFRYCLERIECGIKLAVIFMQKKLPSQHAEGFAILGFVFLMVLGWQEVANAEMCYIRMHFKDESSEDPHHVEGISILASHHLRKLGFDGEYVIERNMQYTSAEWPFTVFIRKVDENGKDIGSSFNDSCVREATIDWTMTGDPNFIKYSGCQDYIEWLKPGAKYGSWTVYGLHRYDDQVVFHSIRKLIISATTSHENLNAINRLACLVPWGDIDKSLNSKTFGGASIPASLKDYGTKPGFPPKCSNFGCIPGKSLGKETADRKHSAPRVNDNIDAAAPDVVTGAY